MTYISTKDQKYVTQMALTGITDSTLTIIHKYKEHLLPLVDSIVDELYNQVYKVEQLRKIIDLHSNLEKLKKTQRQYLRQVFSPVINDQYIKNRLLIGKVHSRIGLDLPWFISTNRSYSQIISNHLSVLLPPDEALFLLNALESLFNFDMQLTVEAYNQMEVDKALFPLRYEFKHLQKKKGLVEEDFQLLDAFSGRIIFRLDSVMEDYYHALLKRAPTEQIAHLLHLYIPYMKRFLKHFFQEKVYQDEVTCYRIFRDWTREIINHKINDHLLTTLVDTLNEVLRNTFF